MIVVIMSDAVCRPLRVHDLCGLCVDRRDHGPAKAGHYYVRITTINAEFAEILLQPDFRLAGIIWTAARISAIGYTIDPANG